MSKKPQPLTLERAADLSDAEVRKGFAKLDPVARDQLLLDMLMFVRGALRRQQSGQ